MLLAPLRGAAAEFGRDPLDLSKSVLQALVRLNHEIGFCTLFSIGYLAGVDGAKFRKPVRPGDQLRIEMKVIRRKANLAKMAGTATVNGVVVAEAEMLCVLTDRTP